MLQEAFSHVCYHLVNTVVLKGSWHVGLVGNLEYTPKRYISPGAFRISEQVRIVVLRKSSSSGSGGYWIAHPRVLRGLFKWLWPNLPTYKLSYNQVGWPQIGPDGINTLYNWAIWILNAPTNVTLLSPLQPHLCSHRKYSVNNWLQMNNL